MISSIYPLLIILLIPLILSKPLQISSTHAFIDSQNRERYFHGVNIVMKTYPYHPLTESFDPNLSFHEQDMQNLEAWGLNVIRLGTQWPGYEPQRGQYNSTYLEILDSIVNKSSQHNIYTLLDFHQDVLNEKFCGEGIPLWAVKEPDYAWAFPRPLQLASYILDKEGLPTHEDCQLHDWPSYHFAFQTSAAYQSLYDNVDGIQDSFGEFWKRIAENFKSNEYVIGYELINEPFAGNVIENPLRLIPSYADRYNLMHMYDNINGYIRQVDEDHIVFFESVTWDDFISIGFDHVPGGDSFANRSAISYHYYDQVNFNINWQLGARMKDRNRLNTGSACTEFAICVGSQPDFDALETELIAFDDNLQSWMGWSYKGYGGITGDCGNVYDGNGNINTAVVQKLSRTYAQAVAGRTTKMSYNNETKEFHLEYTVCADCGGETEIYLNEDIHYETGFEVVVNEQKVQWYQPKKNRVHIKSLNTVEGDLIQIDIRKKASVKIQEVEEKNDIFLKNN